MGMNKDHLLTFNGAKKSRGSVSHSKQSDYRRRLAKVKLKNPSKKITKMKTSTLQNNN
uniref:Uncharacterized protein n=1 Tax=Rhizophora mucronata TaxID=61149 RepID=A0A2P2MPA0_RHIMU